jgi:hypothetical protein
MPIRRIITCVALIALVAGCGSSATSAPGAATAPAASAASGAPTAAAIASTQPSAAATGGLVLPSFAGDPDLAAKFPKEVAGKPVTNVTTARMVDFFAAFQTPQDQIDKTRADMTAIGVNIDSLVVGFGQATVGTSTVQIQATRAPGVDASKLLPVAAQLSMNDPATDKVTTETVGGKSVSVVRDQGGYASSWLYAKDDVIWELNTSSQDEATAVFSALP